MNFLSSKETFEDMKEISRKSKEDRPCHVQKQKDKSTMIYKALHRKHKIPQHEFYTNGGLIMCSRMVRSSFSSNGIRRATLVKKTKVNKKY